MEAQSVVPGCREKLRIFLIIWPFNRYFNIVCGLGFKSKGSGFDFHKCYVQFHLWPITRARCFSHIDLQPQLASLLLVHLGSCNIHLPSQDVGLFNSLLTNRPGPVEMHFKVKILTQVVSLDSWTD